MTTTPAVLGRRLVDLVVSALEALERTHLPGWRIPRTFAGHAVGADVRADLCFTLTQLASAGVGEVAGQPLDDIVAGLLGSVDGAATHTFFSYRIAETLLRAGPFADNPLLRGLDERRRAEVAQAVDSRDWVELLDAGGLPRNYAAVLARCELDRDALGLVDDRAALDGLVERVRELLGEHPAGLLDDSTDRAGRYDIYSADVWLFCEPLASRLGPVWNDGFRGALELVEAVGARDGSAVPWGRSTGALAAALTVELGALALARGLPEDRAAAWLRRAADATVTLGLGFDDDGLSNAHRQRDQDRYRGPARRLQLTLDLLGKLAWSAVRLVETSAQIHAASAAETYPPQDRWVPFEADRPVGALTYRGPGVDFVIPFVGSTRSHYLPAPHQPGTWEVPVDRDLPTWTPLVLAGGGRYTAGGIPSTIQDGDGFLAATWVGLPPSGRGVEGGAAGSPLDATVTTRWSVDGRTIEVAHELTFPTGTTVDAIGLAIPEVAGRPLQVEWASDGGYAATTVTVEGLAEWRSSWSEIARVHQADLDPAPRASIRARVTPLIRLGSTELAHHYSRSLYRPMADRVVAGPSPVGWNAVADPGFRHLDLLHLHWPEWLAFDDLAAHEAIIAELADHDIPVVWTAHNLAPHAKQPEVFEPIYAAWAAAVSAMIHHSAWGEAQFRDRYRCDPACRHEVIPHGHFGDLWQRAGLPAREEAQRRLGLDPVPLRIGIVGAPRVEKLVQVALDAVAACGRDDLELVCWSLGPDDVVPDDPRIAIAERYREVDRPTYATRLASCDVLALVFDPDGEMLTTGSAADAMGLGRPALRSEWGYLVEHLGAAGIPVGHTVDSVAAALDALTEDRLAVARAAAAVRKDALGWPVLADRTVSLLERVLQRLP